MRQAGRSLPEYRAARKKRKSMLAACTTPDLVTEITLQPLRRYHVDAAILFSDIVVPLRAVGVDVDIKPGIGPVIGQPVRSEADLARLRALEPPDVAYLVPAISSLVAELGSHAADRLRRRPVHAGVLPGGRRAVEEPGADQGADVRRPAAVARPARPAHRHHHRVPAGPGLRRAPPRSSFSTPGSGRSARRTTGRRCCRTASGSSRHSPGPGVPRLHFGVGTGELLGLMSEAGADVVGVDWRVSLDEAVRRVDIGTALQGNLDPAVLLAPWEVVEAAGQGRAVPRPRRGRAHLQPRARGAAGDRPGCAGPPGRLGARGVGAGSATAKR